MGDGNATLEFQGGVGQQCDNLILFGRFMYHAMIICYNIYNVLLYLNYLRLSFQTKDCIFFFLAWHREMFVYLTVLER